MIDRYSEEEITMLLEQAARCVSWLDYDGAEDAVSLLEVLLHDEVTNN